MLRRFRRALLAVGIAVLVLAAGHQDYRPSSLDLAVSPYTYSIVKWELAHFLEKWVRKAGHLMPWSQETDRGARNSLAQDFFLLGQELAGLEQRLQFEAGAGSGQLNSMEANALRSQVQDLRKRLRSQRPLVEEAIESEISAVLAEEGFSSRIGLIFPPVDTVFSSSPTVLVLSPRDRIFRLRTILLAPGLSDEEKEAIEGRVFREENLAALVAPTGGVAAYPSVVSNAGSLHHAVVTAAHEWLHHWFFLRPLGRHFWDSPEMTTLNETAAGLGGQEIGDQVFTAMTGKPVDHRTRTLPPDQRTFNFNQVMRETRLSTEELLAQGRIEEAEAYMEQRRQLMVANGYPIRKINQAFFAFHGSYAGNPASVSPIDGQVQYLRRQSGSLGEFLKLIASFGSHQAFVDYLETGNRASDGRSPN